MTDEKKAPSVVFAPGCFDSFEGTQEELDEMMAEIMKMVESGELIEGGQELTEEEWNELPDDVKIQLMQSFDVEDEDGTDLMDSIEESRKRRLQ